ncbi:hypothetical protein SAMN05216257_10463 [Meinhardsimonia xiamenensis]|jgi:hypothetical protein|uniref:Uncharacterized protein n=1 Tax=Meinhardsimonia xiamenensis TaxID=990712 RepID=A0A1G9DXH0_9RHOB|nr:hypothetical protein [Meinhardsimonia xiamenensis]PRX31157.1 hypothetical protein LV81_02664 [Meinhardsimonia xiamenensis]SDK68509.1 hypothetical protein SAMN05216257_10463 [Meinhardsimonia xiamenensis]
MKGDSRRRRISFPVTVWYDEEREEIFIARLTGQVFVTSVSRHEGDERFHAELFEALGEVLREAGAPAPARGGPIRRH